MIRTPSHHHTQAEFELTLAEKKQLRSKFGHALKSAPSEAFRRRPIL